MRCLPGLVALVVATTVSGGEPIDAPGEEGGAHVWHLGHAGWLVRTSEHSLIFDYTGPIEAGTLSNGTLSAEMLAGQRVVLFVSHGHGDHFDRRVLGLRDRVEDLVVVMGWGEPGSGAVVVPAFGEWTEVSGAEVFALHHAFDGIPEGFFLVRSGGVTIYHSGDHGTWSDPPNQTFRTNIDRISAAAGQVDIAFISAFGDRGGGGALNPGDVYTLEKLEPKVTFPMHRIGQERVYATYAREVEALGLPTTVGVADGAGAFFSYKDGKLDDPARE